MNLEAQKYSCDFYEKKKVYRQGRGAHLQKAQILGSIL